MLSYEHMVFLFHSVSYHCSDFNISLAISYVYSSYIKAPTPTNIMKEISGDVGFQNTLSYKPWNIRAYSLSVVQSITIKLSGGQNYDASYMFYQTLSRP
mmetsp:Transcript_27983/g.41638  ORF Transcript_27983/g.41638 Transcript_27983/m.41638 type:complete len:99 (+) Transcript_27983:1932-2228(+)